MEVAGYSCGVCRGGGRWAVEVEMECMYTKEISLGTRYNKYYCNATQRK